MNAALPEEKQPRDGADWSPHLAQIEKMMKGKPFWKVALFCLMCVERQWPVYERLSVGREWGNAAALSKVIDRFFKAIATGYAIGDSFYGMIDDSIVVAEEDWDVLAGEFVTNIQAIFEMLADKDKSAARVFADRNAQFLDVYLDFEATDYPGIHPLVEKEKAFQLRLAEKIEQVQTLEKALFLEECRANFPESILGDFWFENYPDYQPIKRRKTKPAGDGLRFRTAHQIKCSTNKDWMLVKENREKLFLALDAFQKSGYQADAFLAEPGFILPNGNKRWSLAQSLIKMFSQKEYARLYTSLCHDYFSLAESGYLSGRPMEETLQRLYQAGKCAIISARLHDEIPEKEQKERKLQRPSWGFGRSMLLQAMLIYAYDEAARLLNEQDSPYAGFLCNMLLGRYSQAEAYLKACESSADPLYRGADLRLVQALFGRDAEDIRACAVQMIRAIRRVEDLYREVFPIFPILVVRCAAQTGVPIRKIDVSELPEALLGEKSPFHIESSQPFGLERFLESRPTPI